MVFRGDGGNGYNHEQRSWHLTDSLMAEQGKSRVLFGGCTRKSGSGIKSNVRVPAGPLRDRRGINECGLSSRTAVYSDLIIPPSLPRDGSMNSDRDMTS